jgi:hypothetical protein
MPSSMRALPEFLMSPSVELLMWIGALERV